MTKESAVAKYSPFGRERPGTPSNLIQVNFVNKSRLPENITPLPESSPNLTIVRPDQRLAQIIEFPNPKIDTSANLIRPEISLLEKTRKAEVFNPSKKSKSYIDHMGRHILIRRSRRGSRCLAQPDHEPADCQGRKHLKKSKTKEEKQMQTKVPLEKKDKPRRWNVVLNGKRIN